MITTSDRVKFLGQASVSLNELTKLSVKTYDSIAEVAKKINVSAVYKVTNCAADLATNINVQSRKISTALSDILGVYSKNEFNTGDYKDQVKATKNLVEDNKPAFREMDHVSLNADGNEDMSTSNIETLKDAIRCYAKESKATLLDLSATAGKLKADDNNMARNIGSSVETLTNDVISLGNTLNAAIAEMAQQYHIELVTIEDLSSAIRGTVSTANSDSDIKVASMEI